MTINELSGIGVNAADILYAYAQALMVEKIWTALGTKSGINARKTVLIVHSFYELNQAVAAFRSHLACCMHELRYESCYAGPDLWMQAIL